MNNGNGSMDLAMNVSRGSATEPFRLFGFKGLGFRVWGLGFRV